jgi:hypothetical protein
LKITRDAFFQHCKQLQKRKFFSALKLGLKMVALYVFSGSFNPTYVAMWDKNRELKNILVKKLPT